MSNQKILLVNGSPHEKGCTHTVLTEIASVFRGEGSGGSGIVDRRAKEEAVIGPGNRQEIIDTILKHTFFLWGHMPVISSRYWNMVHGSSPEEVLADKELPPVFSAIISATIAVLPFSTTPTL